MSDPYAAAPIADEIVDADDLRSARLEREADDLLARSEGRSYAPVTSVREAVREDVRHGRDWARSRAVRARETIQDQPLRTAAYAIGAGVLIGLLIRR